MKRLPSLLLVLAIVLPLFSGLRYRPLTDWWSDAGSLALIALAWLARLLLERGKVPSSVLPLALMLALGWLLLAVLLPAAGNQAGFLPVLKISAFLIMAFAGGTLAYREAQNHGRKQLLVMLAWGLLLAAVAQAIIGLAQASGVASLAQGYAFVDPDPAKAMIPLGNIGQRNLFAHFLGWGALGGSYLFASRRLHWAIWLPLVAFLSLLMAWSGSRLVLAYAGGFMLLAGFWWWQAGRDPVVRRLAMALVGVMLLIMLAQLFNQEMVALIHSSGADIQAVSGADRLLADGFGARRRIEWSKAWQVLQAHPLFGTGFGSYAWQSVWYEAYGGYPKVVESGLFTNAHSLIFQLLAETGLIGAIGALLALAWCLLPYLRKQEATAENLLLIGVAMITLGHSLFEYPLWYMPFLTCFAVILCLSPARPLQLAIRPVMRTVLALSLSFAAIGYSISGVPTFWRLVYWLVPSPVAEENSYRMHELIAFRQNPLWASDVDLVLSNYLFPRREQLPVQLALFKDLVRYRPYPEALIKLAMLEALGNQPQKALSTLAMALAAFPHVAEKATHMLSIYPEPEYLPLKNMAAKAFSVYQHEGPEAAASAVSKAEYRQTLF